MARAFLIIIAGLSILAFALTSVSATSLDWKGYTWNNEEYGGNTIQVMDGNLVVTTDALPYGGNWHNGSALYTTDAVFRSLPTPWVQCTGIDSYYYVAPDWAANGGPHMTVTGQGWVARIEAIPGQSLYTVTEHFDGGAWNTFWCGPSRSATSHTYKIAKRADGRLDYFIDGVLRRTTTSAFPGYFATVNLYSFANDQAFPGTRTEVSITFTDYQAATPPGTTISAAKLSPENTSVYFDQNAVTAAFTDFFYIEEDDRSAGIRVNSPGHAVEAGIRASFAGTVKTDANGERYIEATSPTGGMEGSIKPIGLSSRAVGGADFGDPGALSGQKGIEGRCGTNNVGLLVKVWGAVGYKAPDASYLYLDDGSGITDASGHTGIRIRLEYQQRTPDDLPNTGDWLIVTGPVCLVKDTTSNAVVPAILPRAEQSSLVVQETSLGPDNPPFKFDDESPTLDFTLFNNSPTETIRGKLRADIVGFNITSNLVDWSTYNRIDTRYPPDLSVPMGDVEIGPQSSLQVQTVVPTGLSARRYDVTLRLETDDLTSVAIPSGYFYVTKRVLPADLVGLCISNYNPLFNGPSAETSLWSNMGIVSERRMHSLEMTQDNSQLESLINSIAAVGMKNYFSSMATWETVKTPNDPAVKQDIRTRVQSDAQRVKDLPIVTLIQYDNEPMSEPGPHTPTSYDPGGVWFRAWLQQRYSTITALNQAWGTNYTDWPQVGLPEWNATNVWNQPAVWLDHVVAARTDAPTTPNIHQCIDWKRYAYGSYADRFRYAHDCFREVNQTTAFNTNFVAPPYMPGFVFNLSEFMDFGGIDQNTPGGMKAQGGCMSWSFNGLDMLESVFAPRPLAMHENYIYSFDPPELPGAQAWLMIGRGFKTIYYFMWKDWISGNVCGVDTQCGLVDSNNNPHPTYSSFVKAANDVRSFHNQFDVNSMRRLKTRVAIYISSDDWLTFYLCNPSQTGDTPWNSLNMKSQTGLYWLLARNGYVVDWLDDKRLTRLGDYSAVFVPRMDIISQDAVTALMDYVRSGGVLISDGLLGAGDPMGWAYDQSPGGPAFADVGWHQKNLTYSGSRYLLAVPGNPLGIPDGLGITTAGTPQNLTVDPASTIIMCTTTGQPGLVRRTVGSGTVYYFTSSIGCRLEAYRGTPDENMLTVMRKVMEATGQSPQMVVEMDAASKARVVDITDWCAPDLNGNHPVLEGSMRVKGSDQLFLFLVSWFGPSSGKVYVALPAGSYEATNALTGAPIALTQSGGKWSFPASLGAYGQLVVRIRCANGSPFGNW